MLISLGPSSCKSAPPLFGTTAAVAMPANLAARRAMACEMHFTACASSKVTKDGSTWKVTASAALSARRSMVVSASAIERIEESTAHLVCTVDTSAIVWLFSEPQIVFEMSSVPSIQEQFSKARLKTSPTLSFRVFEILD